MIWCHQSDYWKINLHHPLLWNLDQHSTWGSVSEFFSHTRCVQVFILQYITFVVLVVLLPLVSYWSAILLHDKPTAVLEHCLPQEGS